jgi:CBS domain containing-hemolysin-like protein
MIAIVGEAASPRGLVTLKDLVEEISGDLAGW